MLSHNKLTMCLYTAHQLQLSTIETLDSNFTQFSTRLGVVRKSKEANTRILTGIGCLVRICLHKAYMLQMVG